MDWSGAGAFVYAKASGIIGKSFIGPRTAELYEQKSLSELWTLLFNSQAPLIPEVMLAQKIEEEAFSRFLNQYIYFINQYSKPEQILLAQLDVYEAENLKEVGAALCSGEKKCPPVVNLGNLANLNFDAWPDVSKITEKSEYAWYDHVPGIHEQQELEFKIDTQVVKNLWSGIEAFRGEEKDALLKLYKTEYIIKNIVWALRLRVHYDMSKEDILPKLIRVTEGPIQQDPIAAPVAEVLNMPLDDYEIWKKWKYSDLINPMMDNGVWTINPSWIENKNKIKVNNLAMLIFHQYPMSVTAIIGWYKIKKFELSCIRTAVESLRLNIPSEVAKETVGIAL